MQTVCQNWKNFRYAWSSFLQQLNTEMSSWYPIACNSMFFNPKTNPSSNWGYNFEPLAFFNDMAHIIDVEKLRTYLVFGFILNTRYLINFEHTNRKRKNKGRSPKFIPENNKLLLFILMSINRTSIWAPHELRDMDLTVSSSISDFPYRYLKTSWYPPNIKSSNKNTPISSGFLHYDQRTVLRQLWASNLHFFKKITGHTDAWTKQLLYFKSWWWFESPSKAGSSSIQDEL